MVYILRVILTLTAGVRPAQDSVTFDRPDQSVQIAAGDIAGLVEVGPNKILIARSGAPGLWLIDFGAKTASGVGKLGSGPNEFTTPVGIIPLADGTFLIPDPSNERFLTLSKTGTITGTKPFTEFAPVTELLMEDIPQTDAKGRWYFELGRAATFNGDSMAIIRWTPGQSKLDTVAYAKEFLSSDPLAKKSKRPPPPPAFGGGGFAPPPKKGRPLYEPQETWVVGPTGKLFRATPEPFLMIWYDEPLKPAAGSKINYEPVPIGKEEEERIKKQIEQYAEMLKLTGANTDSTEESQNKPDEIDLSFDKPPFPNRSAGLIGPDGGFWLLRSTDPKNPPFYNRFDAKGNIVGTVVLPVGASVVGVTKGTVYIVRPVPKEKGKVTLERFTWPRKK